MANDTRPYSSPNFPKEEKKEEKKKDRSQETRPYSSPNFKKEETNKTETPVITGHTTPPYSSPNYTQPSQQQNNTSAASSQSQNQNQNRGNNIFNLNTPAAKQAQANATFINSLNPTNAFSINPANVLNNSETSQIFNNVTQENRKTPPNLELLTKSVNAKTIKTNRDVIEAVKAKQKREKEVEDFKNMFESTFWDSGRKKSVSYATSIDYYDMERRGFETVFVEDGDGRLEEKAGVFTIGRDKLEGLPKDVKMVMVDKNNNWKYIANTGKRADFVETMTAQRDAATLRYENNITQENKNLIANKFTLNKLEKQLNYLEHQANKTRKPEDFEAYQNAIVQYNDCIQAINKNYSNLHDYGTAWALKYETYNNAINNTTKWTMEEEARYQQLKTELENAVKYGNQYTSVVTSGKDKRPYSTPYSDVDLTNKVSGKALLYTEFAELSKRREANKDSAVYMNNDALMSLDTLSKNMQKAIDEYNKWDSVTIHTENGEALGAIIKRAMMTTLNYDVHNDTFTNISNALRAFNPALNMYDTADRLLNDEAYKEEVKDIYKDTWTATKKNFTPIGVMVSEMNKASDAYKAVNDRINRGDYTSPEELADLRAKRLEYIAANEAALKQGRNIMFNNVISNLSVFDMTSIEDLFVAWRMAKHPERYADDPKFKKMQDAYKVIYGTNYRGDMDAGKMAKAMLSIRGKDFGNDYIYLDASDLRHKNGNNYGFFASLAVGTLTDIGSLAGVAENVLNTGLKIGGTKIIADTASDSLTKALIHSGVTPDDAVNFVNSKAVQGAIKRDVYGSIKRFIREDGDDLAGSIREALINRSNLLNDMATDDIIKSFDDIKRTAFLREAENLILDSKNITRTSLLIDKGTVLTHALGNIDDALDEAQRLIFKTTCPIAAAVTGVAKLNKYIDVIRNARLATPGLLDDISDELLSRMTKAGTQAMATATDVNYDTVLRSSGLLNKLDNVMNEFRYAVMGTLNSDFIGSTTQQKAIEYFSDASSKYGEDLANGLAADVLSVFESTLNSRGIQGLEDLAKEFNYTSAEELIANATDNLKSIYKYSDDAQTIISSFKSSYDTRVMHFKLDQAKIYVDNTKQHINELKSLMNTNGVPMLSLVNAKHNPAFVSGLAEDVKNVIHTFCYDLDNDYSTFINNAGNPQSIIEAGVDAINALNDISLGIISDKATVQKSLMNADLALHEYVDELENVYLKQVEDWYADNYREAFGQQDYFKVLGLPNTNYAETRETMNSLVGSFQNILRDNKFDNPEDLVSEFIKTNEKDFTKLDMQQRDAVIYRVMQSKGSGMLLQTSDESLKAVTDQLTNCNSQLNKTLSTLQYCTKDNDNMIAGIKNAVTNASAMGNQRKLFNELKLSGVDDSTIMAFADVTSGQYSGDINRLLQSYSSEVFAEKAGDYIVDQAKKQLALHNGEYSLYTHLNCNTVDVRTNVANIEKNLEGFVPEDDNFIDICVSAVRSTDESAPKDIAFHVRGSKDTPKVLRKKGMFTVYDDRFASRTYGTTAQRLNDDYAKLGFLNTVDSDEWTKGLKDYINEQKQIALEQNKTIRFIGFNSSDAVSGDNKFITDVLRSCGVSANTANTIDLADLMRAADGEVVFSSESVAALKRGLRIAADSAEADSITLGIRKSIAYDSKIVCTDILKDTFKNIKFNDDLMDAQVKYILDGVQTVEDRLGAKAYNEAGQALGLYVDATNFDKLYKDAGYTDINTRKLITKAVTDATVSGEPQINIHKIIDYTLTEKWIDHNNLKPNKLNDLEYMERVNDAVLRINNINEGLRRTDLLTDADVPGLKTMYNELLRSTAIHKPTGLAYTIMSSLKVDSFSPQQLYAVNRWALDNLQRAIDPNKYDEIMGILLTKNSRVASKLTDEGYKFIRNNIVDYTNDAVPAFINKYLDTSEESFRYSQALDDIAKRKDMSDNLELYSDAIHDLFTKEHIHGVQDQMIALQTANAIKPIRETLRELETVQQVAYKEAREELVKQYGKRFSEEMLDKIATNKSVDRAKRQKAMLGEKARTNAIRAVVDLDAESFKAHITRNCLGGLVIEPADKCMQGINIPMLFEQWKGYGAKIEPITFTQGTVSNRKLYRVYFPDLATANKDEIFAKYTNTHINFDNKVTNRYNIGDIRHSSFGASDMTLVDAHHANAFRDAFFKDTPDTILDIEQNFRPWRNELYCCNMWTSMEVKQCINPYYTDDILNNLAQNTHQLKENLNAIHDLGTIVNNRYVNTKHILQDAHIVRGNNVIAQREAITQQLKNGKQRLCTITLDKHNKYHVVDYTEKALSKRTNDEFFEKIINNTVMLEPSMVTELSDWAKSTTMALRLQSNNAKDWLTIPYNTYKKTIRSTVISTFLYGSLGTAVRNFVDSATKGFNEVVQYDGDVLTYLYHYINGVSDAHEYTNICRYIEDNLGAVNRNTVAEYFKNNPDGFNKFNMLHGYEHTCGGDSIIQDLTLDEIHTKNIDYIQEGLNIDRDTAAQVRKTFDSVYGSYPYYGMTSAQLEKHMVEIHDKCKESLKKEFKYNPKTKNYAHGKYSNADIDAIMEKFWDYEPTVLSWGDQLTRFPVLGFNKARFNNAETRARLAIYQTFMSEGMSEFEAMQHVTATQFHYAGLGKVEDFMPFTQYKLYNALYWFDHANARAVSTAWRAAQYNGDGYSTNQEISDMIAKYRQKSYYIYDAGADKSYDQYYEQNIAPMVNTLADEAIDSYLGVPRTFNAGNLDLNGTHYIKLGNSFVEELDMISSWMSSAAVLAATIRGDFDSPDKRLNMRMAFQTFKCTPFYDSFYSPWRNYADLIAYTYDNYELITDKPLSKISLTDIPNIYEHYMYNQSTKSQAITGIPLCGAILSNMLGRWKSFNLNKGLLAALAIDTNAQQELFSYTRDLLCDVAGMFVPSVFGTKVEPDKNPYNYYVELGKQMMIKNPTTYFDFKGRLQRDMGFKPEEADAIMEVMKASWAEGMYISKKRYYEYALELFDRGFTPDEIINLFKQEHIPEKEVQRFMYMSNALPAYLKYDKEKRSQIIAYYKALGMSSDEAWAKLINSPALIINGNIVELNYSDVYKYDRLQNLTYRAVTSASKDNLTKEEWKAYWDTIRAEHHYYPKGKWSEAYEYLKSMGYSADKARKVLLHGYMLDENGMLVDAVGKVRARTYSYSTLKGAEWDAYWNSLPDYTKYEKGAFGRTMKALKKQGYSDADARALIQQGIYVDKNGNMMNVTGMERPVLGFPNFSAYYNSIPEYCRYEKGAFSRTYKALKALGFDYDTSLMLIQQGAYLMDMSLAGSLVQTLGARRNKDGSDITVTDINSLLARYGGQVIMGADGKQYMLIDCSGLTRPRRTFSYARGGRSYGGRGYGSRSYSRRSYGSRGPKLSNYKLRSPFVINGNVSTYNGFTNYRGSYKLQKPYTTKGYVSTFSTQNFLNGASYGMRKTYKIDMRQFKSGALSTKSAYPTSYRNIAVAYRRNMYKDLYAKYGMSRMRMRANKQGYSNAAITRLRRNEIANRERYAERRDQITKLNTTKKKASS